MIRRRFVNDVRLFDGSKYMTIEPLENIELYFESADVEYTKDGITWLPLKPTMVLRLQKEELCYFRRYTQKKESVGRCIVQGCFNLKGNCLSLIFGDNTDWAYSLMGYDDVFAELFVNTEVISVEEDFLPAKILAPYCYARMFEACHKLINAPYLLATDLLRRCYDRMFYGCESLNYIKMLATNISADRCLEDWVYGVSPTGIFVKSKDATWDVRGVNGIPEGWTVITDDYPTNSVGMPDSKEFGFPLFLNTEYLGETDYTIVMYRDVKDIIEPFASWFSQNTDGYGGVHSDVLYRDRIFIDGYIVTRMYYDQSLDALMMETQKDYGNDSSIGISSDGNLYVTIAKQQVGGAVEISFNIDGRDYTAAKGMTWKQWVQSSYYNPSYGENKIYIVENTVYVYSYAGNWYLIGQNGSDFIIEGTRYALYGPVPAPEL